MIEALDAPTIQTWKTVKLGVHKTAGEYLQVLKSAKYHISDWVNDILGKAELTCSTEETDVDLVVLSVAELGFKNGSKHSEICVRAMKMGLLLCPVEVGPALRLTYKDQPRGEWLIIAVNAISGSDDVLELVSVEHDHDDGLSISGYRGSSDRFWHSDHRFVFVRRK
jgi:hypothetical protein